jgi:hypothetical protein
LPKNADILKNPEYRDLLVESEESLKIKLPVHSFGNVKSSFLKKSFLSSTGEDTTKRSFINGEKWFKEDPVEKYQRISNLIPGGSEEDDE